MGREGDEQRGPQTHGTARGYFPTCMIKEGKREFLRSKIKEDILFPTAAQGKSSWKSPARTAYIRYV